MQNVLKKEETIVNSTTRSENIQIMDYFEGVEPLSVINPPPPLS